jgi:hypothetical protein
LAIFFLLPSKKFLLISFKIQLSETFPQKQKEKKTKAARSLFTYVFSLPVHFEFFAIFSYCLHLSRLSACRDRTGMAEKSSWDQQGNIWQKIGLVWRSRKKISQNIKDKFYLPFFLLIILWITVIPYRAKMSNMAFLTLGD